MDAGRAAEQTTALVALVVALVVIVAAVDLLRPDRSGDDDHPNE